MGEMTIKGVTRVVCFALGIFEFFSAFDFFLNAKERVKENLVFPEIWSDSNVIPLFIAFVLMLGLLRLHWSLGRNGIVEWTALLLGHVVEMVMWWTLAYNQKLIHENENFLEFIPRAIQLGRGVPILLFGKMCCHYVCNCHSTLVALTQFI